MRSNDFSDTSRVLILAPTLKDTEVTVRILNERGFEALPCSSLTELCEKIGQGAEVALVTEEHLLSDKTGCVQDVLARQEPWSDFPLIVLTRAGGTSESTNRNLEAIGNMTLMSRPMHIAALLSHVRTALRDRKRQYRIRDQLADQKAKAHEVSEAREYLELMLGSATDFAIISLGTDGKIVKWSDGASRIFGYSSEEATGCPIDTIFTPEDVEANVASKEMSIASEAGRASDERWHLKKNGTRFYASGTMAAMYDAEGVLCGFVKIARDMTTQKKVAEDLVSARNAADAANIAKTEFLANMSHEIRTPMNAVIGLSSILAMSQPLTDKQMQFISTLRTSADSLLALINDLLDIAKIEARSVELEEIPFSVSVLLQEMASMMSVRVREKNLVLGGNFTDLPNRMFLGDPTRLRQILVNLCSNAIKFTDQGQVTIDAVFEAGVDTGVQPITFRIQDSGIGIAPEKVATIFDKFTQGDTSINRKYGGTGLGLAITKTLVAVMGGTIAVESEQGKGSTFIVTLPFKNAADRDVQNSDGSLPGVTQASRKSKRVLLVEDYEPNILVASTLIRQFGYECDIAVSGTEAVEKIKAGNLDVVLMDVQMPGMNGFDATAAVRDHERVNNIARVPIMGMTAHALAGDRERCLSSGMDDYISKPFDPAELDSKIYNLTNRQVA